jgi:hypothetical protein
MPRNPFYSVLITLRNKWKELALSATAVLLCLLLLEGMLHLFMIKPNLTKRIDGPVTRLIKLVYQKERRLIQYSPGCAQYDRELSYTLKPGECEFRNLEFSNKIRVNSLGVRDDEAALLHPEIIVLGDSVSMGWGVEQDEAFPQLIAQKTGIKTLNASVASYGTVREMKLLNRVDVSNAKYLVVSYCTNDYWENRSFYNNGDIRIMSRQDYDMLVTENIKQSSYSVGMHLYDTITGIYQKLHPVRRDMNLQAIAPEQEVKFFLNALMKAGKNDMSGWQIAVLTGLCTNARFARVLDTELREGKYPQAIKSASVLDFSRTVTGDKYHILDDHMNRAGHEVVATEIIEALNLVPARHVQAEPVRDHGNSHMRRTSAASGQASNGFVRVQ